MDINIIYICMCVFKKQLCRDERKIYMCEKKKKETNEECDKKVYQKYISIFLYIYTYKSNLHL